VRCKRSSPMNPFVRFGLLALCVAFLAWRFMSRWRAASAMSQAYQGAQAGAVESVTELRSHPRLNELLGAIGPQYRVTFGAPWPANMASSTSL
jgi:hypothetical protein